MTDQQRKQDQTYEVYADDPEKIRVPPAHEQLLATVLGETLNRRADDPKILFESLCRWRSGIDASDFDATICEVLVLRVLNHRLGDAIAEVPMQLYREVAGSLWDNPECRKRMEKIWKSLTP